jgi:hypothetical protein
MENSVALFGASRFRRIGMSAIAEPPTKALSTKLFKAADKRSHTIREKKDVRTSRL